MDWRIDPDLMGWLSSEENPPVRYLAGRDLLRPQPSAESLATLHRAVRDWEPLQRVLALQREDGSFAAGDEPGDARPTFWALLIMQRCGLDVTDEAVARAISHLDQQPRSVGALSYTSGGSGVLPCYLGVVTTGLIKMGALDSEIVQSSIRWLVDYQRFDHKETRAGGDKAWSYRAPQTYGCWESVSCFHGVAGAFRALAAIPAGQRTEAVRHRLDEAIEYLRIHHLYRKSASDRPLFRHMTQPFLVGDYRSDLLDMLQGIADTGPELVREQWVHDAMDDMGRLTIDGKVPLLRNYGKRLIDPIPLEPLGEPSRFLTYQWALIQRTLHTAEPAV